MGGLWMMDKRILDGAVVGRMDGWMDGRRMMDGGLSGDGYIVGG